MNYSIQFRLSTLIGWVAAAGFLSVLVFDRSLYGTFAASIGITSLVLVVLYRLKSHLVVCGAIAGFAFPTCLLISFVSETVHKAEIIQGQLYAEDGPAVFFFIVLILLVVFGFYGALIGSSIGCLAQFLKACFGKKPQPRNF